MRSPPKAKLASGGSAAPYSQVRHVDADDEEDHDDREVQQGEITVVLQVVGVPGVGPRDPGEQRDETGRKKEVGLAPGERHDYQGVYQAFSPVMWPLQLATNMRKGYTARNS